ncbi:hypothetical protein HDV01_003594, partial [Terramyces sp. JEL0728]
MTSCRYGANCYRINMDHLRQFEHPISVYMSRTAVTHEEVDEHKWIAQCKDRDQCTDTSPEHLQLYWHDGDLYIDPYEALSKHASEMKDKRLETEQDPVLMNGIELNSSDHPEIRVNSIRSLKDMAMEKVAQAINEAPLNYVNYFQNMPEEICKCYFKLLTFHSLEKLVETNAFEWWQGDLSFSQFNRKLETHYRQLSVSDRTSRELKDPYLMMSDVFVGYQTKKFDEGDSNTLVLNRDYEPGAAFASRELFKKQWHHLTGGVFQDIDLSNLFFAGGAVLAALQPFDPTKDINE